jgi:hypothetical protein
MGVPSLLARAELDVCAGRAATTMAYIKLRPQAQIIQIREFGSLMLLSSGPATGRGLLHPRPHRYKFGVRPPLHSIPAPGIVTRSPPNDR